MAKEAGVVTVVDGVSYAAHGFPDIKDLGCDVYLFSLYKTYGPHQGLMVVRESLLPTLANQGHFFNDTNVRKRLVPAGPDHAQVAAAAGIAESYDSVFQHHFPNEIASSQNRRTKIHQLFREHEVNLLKPLLKFCNDRDGVHLIGPNDPTLRAPTVSLNVGEDSLQWVKKLADEKIMCSAGHFYAQRLVSALNLPVDSGVLRLSFVHYTSEEDIQQLIHALDTVAKQLNNS